MASARTAICQTEADDKVWPLNPDAQSGFGDTSDPHVRFEQITSDLAGVVNRFDK